MVPTNNEEAQSYLTLGDGDFSYSLDLAQFLASFPLAATKNNIDGCSNESQTSSKTKLVVTGIDSYDELRLKYKDVNSILAKLQQFNHKKTKKSKEQKKPKLSNDDISSKVNKNNDSENGLSVHVHHSINAIVNDASDLRSTTTYHSNPNLPFKKSSFHHVIFNHPHLGTEDAQMHQCFLSHFFHSAKSFWLHSPGGVLHLTLVCTKNQNNIQ